jgi:hypothetical protein
VTSDTDALPAPERVDALKKRTGEAIHKGAVMGALDSALDVVAQLQTIMREDSLPWTTGERQTLAVTLEQMGRLCWSVARECERRKGAAK